MASCYVCMITHRWCLDKTAGCDHVDDSHALSHTKCASLLMSSRFTFVLFQTEFEAEYQEALNKCFMLCIPDTVSLEDAKFDKQFVGNYEYKLLLLFNTDMSC